VGELRRLAAAGTLSAKGSDSGGGRAHSELKCKLALLERELERPSLGV
jgi:hypothetical protein